MNWLGQAYPECYWESQNKTPSLTMQAMLTQLGLFPIMESVLTCALDRPLCSCLGLYTRYPRVSATSIGFGELSPESSIKQTILWIFFFPPLQLLLLIPLLLLPFPLPFPFPSLSFFLFLLFLFFSSSTTISPPCLSSFYFSNTLFLLFPFSLFSP